MNSWTRRLSRFDIRRLRVCRHSSQGEEGRDEVERGGVARVGLVIAGGDASELLDALEEVFDEVPPCVHVGVVRYRRFAIGLRRDDGQGAPFVERRPQAVVVERLVGEESAEIYAGDQRLDADAVVPLPRQQDKARKIAEGVDEGDDLGGQPAA